MQYCQITPKQSLNKAYLKEKVTRANIDLFKKNLVEFLDGINEKESEEYAKNLVTKFLYNTYYNGKNQINTAGRIDLAIYEDKKPVVIFEAKRPKSPDMVTIKDLNTKATHELMLYYLQERVDQGNIDIKYLIITNTYDWYIFDASVFDNLFYKNKVLMKDFTDWKDGRKARQDRDFFYDDIARPFLKNLKEEIKFSWFDLKAVEKFAKGNDPKGDESLIDLFKILSPVHLLKQPFANDSNSLDKDFYIELLHIIGLEEKKDERKKIIQRKEKPDPASLIENTIATLIADDKLRKLPEGGKSFGETDEERLFNVALELCITWINRVLFLKLLEGQLLNYHSGDKAYRFLDFKNQPSFDELNKLFFEVLAKVSNKRPPAIQKKYSHIPYLNSSLFDFTSIEEDTILIKSLDDSLPLKLSSSTVLKTENGKKREGTLPTLQYLFEFLDAYDFSSEGKEEIQEENKTLINASVLGLIFEKINGYKDGSFFTPGFITMYMCRETIRRAVLQKFNETKIWKLEKFEQLHNKIEDIKEANEIINSIKICDPAVGSGHFLVSALNEIIAIKSELKILSDRKGNWLRDYSVEVVNDELIISIGHDEFFEYKPGNKESQRVQEALFHEKQTIIENCLFGVDLNPNSVKICRLRLWIELLKNAYYTTESKFTDLETLPNIDINIKQGNSLISRFPLDADLSKALKSIKYSIDDYRAFVNKYKNAADKEEKRGFEKLIEQVKKDFRTEIGKNDPLLIKKNKLGGELYNLLNQAHVFELTEREKKDRDKKKAQLEFDINKLSSQIEGIKNSVIYKDAFEWRFEFPEVLDKEGGFKGFDVVIGNPPYIRQEEFSYAKEYLKQSYKTYAGTADLFVYFIELGLSRLRENGQFVYIVPNKWMKAGYGRPIRNFVKSFQINNILDFGDLPVFDEATTYPSILSISKSKPLSEFSFTIIKSLDFPNDLQTFVEENKSTANLNNLDEEGWTLGNSTIQQLLKKIKLNGVPLGAYVENTIYRGILTGYNEAFIVGNEVKEQLIKDDTNSKKIIKPFLGGKDIKKYSAKEAENYLIFTRRGIDIDNFQAIKKHLNKFKEKLEPKPKTFNGEWKGRKEGNYHWFEIQDSIDYYKEFEKPKIAWPETSLDNQFCYVDAGVYLNKTSFFIPREDDFLLGLLNSKLAKFYLGSIVSKMRGGYFSMSKAYVETLPVAFDKNISKSISKIVKQILSAKKKESDNNIEFHEAEINKLVYQLYGLTKAETEIIEKI